MLFLVSRYRLMQCIARFSCLSYLELSHCRLKDADILHLVPAIEKLEALRALVVRDNKLSEIGWQALVPVLDRSPDIVCVHADSSFEACAARISGPMHHVDVYTGSWFKLASE